MKKEHIETDDGAQPEFFSIYSSTSQDPKSLLTLISLNKGLNMYRMTTSHSEFHSLLKNTETNTPSVKHLQLFMSSCSVKSDKVVLFREQKVNTWSTKVTLGILATSHLTPKLNRRKKIACLKNTGCLLKWVCFTGQLNFDLNQKQHRRRGMMPIHPGVIRE